MPRPLNEIIAHIRMVAANPQVSTTLIQTEDLEALCDAAEIAPTEYKRGVDDALSRMLEKLRIEISDGQQWQEKIK